MGKLRTPNLLLTCSAYKQLDLGLLASGTGYSKVAGQRVH